MEACSTPSGKLRGHLAGASIDQCKWAQLSWIPSFVLQDVGYGPHIFTDAVDAASTNGRHLQSPGALVMASTRLLQAMEGCSGLDA